MWPMRALLAVMRIREEHEMIRRDYGLFGFPRRPISIVFWGMSGMLRSAPPVVLTVIFQRLIIS